MGKSEKGSILRIILAKHFRGNECLWLFRKIMINTTGLQSLADTSDGAKVSASVSEGRHQRCELHGLCLRYI